MLQIAAVLFAVSAIASAVAPDYVTLVLARMLGGFGVGANSVAAGPAEFFAGNIDEVRVFTFAPGQFVVSDLQTTLSFTEPPAVVPVNSGFTLLLAALAMLFAVANARRARTAR